MRNKIIIVFLFFLLIPTHSIFSATIINPYTSIGSQSNPIYIKEIKDPYETQRSIDDATRNTNTQKDNSLKSTYGISNYYDCYNTYNSSCGITADVGNPNTQARCLNLIQYCLESKSLKESYIKKCTPGHVLSGNECVDEVKETPKTCSDGYILKDNECVTKESFYNKVCSNKFGAGFIWYGKINSNGGPDCFSKEENNKICIDKYGSNILFKEFDKEGVRICDCNSGYQWNDTKTSCVIKTIPTKSVTNKSDCNNGYSKNSENKCVENNQLCKDDFGKDSKWGGKMNNKNGPICDCNVGYYWNKEGTECLIVIQTEKNTSNTTEVGLTNLDNQTVTTKEIVKHKSLWVKIKGLFGF